MDVKRLRTFVTVADLGTVSKAALRLRISQSASPPYPVRSATSNTSAASSSLTASAGASS